MADIQISPESPPPINEEDTITLKEVPNLLEHDSLRTFSSSLFYDRTHDARSSKRPI